MNEITNWIQSNWYELSSLCAQFTFLFAGLWFARKILKSMRATQQQFGALLKLSITDSLDERTKASESAQSPVSSVAGERPSPYVMAEWPAAAAKPALSLPETEPRRNVFAAAGRGVIRWLQTPMTSSDVSPWRKAKRWLQAPAGS